MGVSVVLRPISVRVCVCGHDATHEVAFRIGVPAAGPEQDVEVYYRCLPCARMLRAELERSVGVKRLEGGLRA
jgi:hypothetical protein